MGIVSKRDNDLIVSRSEPEGNRLGERDAVYGCKRDRKLKTMIGAQVRARHLLKCYRAIKG